MAETPNCPSCGAAIAASAPEGLCEACLLKMALGAEVAEAAGNVGPHGTMVVSIPLTEKPGERIGRYKLLEQIGEGGCGVVYLADQEEPIRRRVALKVIKPGMDSKHVLARFEAERQALALMDHPHIAKVLDAGATEKGRPYFVMELVKGIPITKYCDENKLDTKSRLELFSQVCHAVQHAHQKGIIHRDIKPSNVLIADHDGLPVPKIIDFGIAKATAGQTLTNNTLFTSLDQFIGTPAYMSPEQAKLSGLDIDTRSDIYSLGVLLYELLTGRTPFGTKRLFEAGFDEIRRIIRDEEPPSPSARISTLDAGEQTTVANQRRSDPLKLRGIIRGDLDWIVMKTLEKDRTRRYETANGLALDIKRYLVGDAILARPPSASYRFAKMVQRNKLVFLSGASVFAALVIGLAIATLALIREHRSRQIAVANEKKAQVEAAKSQQVSQFLKDMFEGVGKSVAKGRDTALLREIMDRTAQRLGRDLTNQPEVEEELRGTIGNIYYYALSDYSKSDAMIRRCLALRKQRLGETNLEVAATEELLGLVLLNEQHFVEAENIERKALTVTTSLLGGTNEAAVNQMIDLGTVLRDEGKFLEAGQLFTRAYSIFGKVYGEDNVRGASILRLQASALQSQGKSNEAFALYHEAAEKGDSYAQEELAWLYHAGVGVALDNSQAVKWFQKSAEAGNPIGQYNMGRVYQYGWGETTNYNEAARWYRKGAEAGNAPAQISLADLYANGLGVPQDYSQALNWYRRCADIGNRTAQHNLGRMYESGLGVEKDLNQAVMWYRKSAQLDLEAAEKGDAQAQNRCAWVFSTSKTLLLRDGTVAVEFAESAVSSTGRKVATYLDTLAAAYAETGNFEKAVRIQEEAIKLLNNDKQKQDYAVRLKLYEDNKPYREP